MFRAGLRMTASTKDDSKAVAHMNAAHKELTEISTRAADMQRRQVQCASENCSSTRDQDNLHFMAKGLDIKAAYAGQPELSLIAGDNPVESMSGNSLRTMRWWSDSF